MKRELKHFPSVGTGTATHALNCRAYPDEKGIETTIYLSRSPSASGGDCRAYPDEKGIETAQVPAKSDKEARRLQSLSR